MQLLSGIKLVIAGPVGAGKTTFIRSLGDVEPVATEMPLIDGAMGDKTTTTVALDFSMVSMDEGEPLLIYGLPGQAHFGFMRSIILEGAVGAVLLLRATDPDLEAHCREWLSDLCDLAPDLPLIVAVTHTDQAQGFSLKPLRAAVAVHGRIAPVFTFDAREREQVRHVVRAMLVAAEA